VELIAGSIGSPMAVGYYPPDGNLAGTEGRLAGGSVAQLASTGTDIGAPVSTSVLRPDTM
jgi:hypothetical protein